MKVGAVRNNTKVLTLGSPNVVGAVGALSRSHHAGTPAPSCREYRLMKAQGRIPYSENCLFWVGAAWPL